MQPELPNECDAIILFFAETLKSRLHSNGTRTTSIRHSLNDETKLVRLWWRKTPCGIIASAPLCTHFAHQHNGKDKSGWSRMGRKRRHFVKWNYLKWCAYCDDETWDDEWIKLHFDSRRKCIIIIFCDSMANLLGSCKIHERLAMARALYCLFELSAAHWCTSYRVVWRSYTQSTRQ